MPMGCSRVRINDPYTVGLFKLAGFTDKDESGAIEKPALGNLWTAKENYKQAADLDNDGAISILEAKYYLLTLKNIPAQAKEAYALTKTDKQALFEIFLKNIRALKNVPEKYLRDDQVDPASAAKAARALALLDQILIIGLSEYRTIEAFLETIYTAVKLKNSPGLAEQFLRDIYARAPKEALMTTLLCAVTILPHSVPIEQRAASLTDILNCAINNNLPHQEMAQVINNALFFAEQCTDENLSNKSFYYAIFAALLDLQWYDNLLDVTSKVLSHEQRSALLKEQAGILAARGLSSSARQFSQEAAISHSKIGPRGLF